MNNYLYNLALKKTEEFVDKREKSVTSDGMNLLALLTGLSLTVDEINDYQLKIDIAETICEIKENVISLFAE